MENNMCITLPISKYEEMVNKIAKLNFLHNFIKTEIDKGNKYPVNESVVLVVTGLANYKKDKEATSEKC